MKYIVISGIEKTVEAEDEKEAKEKFIEYLSEHQEVLDIARRR